MVDVIPAIPSDVGQNLPAFGGDEQHLEVIPLGNSDSFFSNYKKQQQLLLEAAKKGFKDEVLDLLRKRTYVNCKDTLGYSPLMWAIHYSKHFHILSWEI